MQEVFASHDDIVVQTFDIGWRSSLPSDLQKYMFTISIYNGNTAVVDDWSDFQIRVFDSGLVPNKKEPRFRITVT